MPEPFLVLATQNPIESEGTYPLPEAQVDRFMLKVVVDYPAPEDELTVVDRSLAAPAERPRRSSTLEELRELAARARGVYVDPAVSRYAVALAGATRDARGASASPSSRRYVEFGASPRGSINLVLAARALALHPRPRLRRSRRTSRDLAKDVLRHRLVLTYEALAEDVGADAILDAVLAARARAARSSSRERAA